MASGVIGALKFGQTFITATRYSYLVIHYRKRAFIAAHFRRVQKHDIVTSLFRNKQKMFFLLISLCASIGDQSNINSSNSKSSWRKLTRDFLSTSLEFHFSIPFCAIWEINGVRVARDTYPKKKNGSGCFIQWPIFITLWIASASSFGEKESSLSSVMEKIVAL